MTTATATVTHATATVTPAAAARATATAIPAATVPVVPSATAVIPPAGAPAVWARRVSYGISGLFTALLAVDGAAHAANIAPIREAGAELGIPEYLNPVMGVILLASLAGYTWRPTAVLGAILLSGYFGGAVAVNLIHEQPLLNSIMAVTVSVALWGALYLRDARVKAIVPFTRQ